MTIQSLIYSAAFELIHTGSTILSTEYIQDFVNYLRPQGHSPLDINIEFISDLGGMFYVSIKSEDDI